MKEYDVNILPEAIDGLVRIYQDILEWTGSEKLASDYASEIMKFCEGFSSFPARSIKRDDLRPGVRVTNYKGSVRIAYYIQDEQKTVDIVLIESARRDFS